MAAVESRVALADWVVAVSTCPRRPHRRPHRHYRQRSQRKRPQHACRGIEARYYWRWQRLERSAAIPSAAHALLLPQSACVHSQRVHEACLGSSERPLAVDRQVCRR